MSGEASSKWMCKRANAGQAQRAAVREVQKGGVSERRDGVRGYGGTKLQHTSMSALKSSLVPASPAATRGSLSIRSCTSMDSSLLMSATNAVRAAGGLERTKRQAVGELASPKTKAKFACWWPAVDGLPATRSEATGLDAALALLDNEQNGNVVSGS